jgi:hypothetical protein
VLTREATWAPPTKWGYQPKLGLAPAKLNQGNALVLVHQYTIQSLLHHYILLHAWAFLPISAASNMSKCFSDVSLEAIHSVVTVVHIVYCDSKSDQYGSGTLDKPDPHTIGNLSNSL